MYNQKAPLKKEAGPLESWERGNNQSSLITAPLKLNKTYLMIYTWSSIIYFIKISNLAHA